MAVFAIPNPKKTIQVDFPLEKVKLGVKNINLINTKYHFETSNEIFNQYTYRASEFLSIGVYIDINLNKLSEDKTEITVEIRRKLGSFNHAHEITYANEHLMSIIDSISKLIIKSSEEIKELKNQTNKQSNSKKIAAKKNHTKNNLNSKTLTSNAWYEKKWLVLFLCIVFFPVGLYALWKNSTFAKGWKFVITTLIVIVILINLGDSSKIGNYTKEPLPTDFKYKIIDDNSNIELEKNQLDIQLSKKLTEGQIATLAEKLFNSKVKQRRFYIFYSLENSKKVGEVWATSHFDPELEITINELTETKKNSFTNDKILEIKSDTKDDIKLQIERELASINKGVKIGNGENIAALQMDVVLFGAYWKVIQEGEQSTEIETKKIATQLKTKVVELQSKGFPVLRKKYTEFAKNLLWEQDIEVYTTNNGTILNLTGSTFATNKNIKDTQVAINEIITLLRFKQVQYRWYKGQDEFTYYNIESVKDTEPVSF